MLPGEADISLKDGNQRPRTVILQRADGLIEVFWYSGDNIEELGKHKGVVNNMKKFKALKKQPYSAREATGFWALRGKRY